MAEITKKQMTERIWLLYFNRYLFEHGAITENEFLRMNVRIKASRPVGGNEHR